jgi:two-component system, OmpR family, sensor histidine kinase KdpD
MTPPEPPPDEVLSRFRSGLQADASSSAAKPTRGRLRIFFGMAPGVGKTFAMLTAARRLAGQGVDVAIGLVETHGRSETEQLLLGLDVLPRRPVAYRDTVLHEFDFDAALSRRPEVLVVDELAHSNAPGAARGKRWQDVEELLRSGIHVYTTLNVQHLESVNDIVAQITGVAVRETVPDRVFDEADEVELVDLPPDALHERLRAGKVYMAEQAVRAVDPSDGFFRKGNLTALRELALRRTAAWVDSQLQRYRADSGVRAVWPAGERVLVAVSASPSSANLVRAAKRMAAGLHAELVAVHVETTGGERPAGGDRDRLAAHLRLAESLGATTVSLAGPDAAREIVAFARKGNFGRIVAGKTTRTRLHTLLRGSFLDTLIRESGDIEICVVHDDTSSVAAAAPPPPTDSVPTSPATSLHLARAGLASLATVSIGCIVASLLYEPPDLSGEALVMLGSIVLAALWMGRAAAIAASVLAVLAFNFLFTQPRFSLAVDDPSHFIAFIVMLAVGVLVGSLAAQARRQAQHARERARVTASLYALSRSLAAARDERQVAHVVAQHARNLLHADVAVCIHRTTTLVTGARGPELLASAGSPDWLTEQELGVAQWAMDHGSAAGCGTRHLPGAKGRYVPLVGSSSRVGVLCLRSTEMPDPVLLDAIAAQAGSALERVALGDAEQSSRLQAERERIRSALLSSVSHDLRTPLATISGAADTLEHDASGGAIDSQTRAALLRSIVSESQRLNALVENLVFATRLEAGGVHLRREWTTLDDLVGLGLARHRDALAGRHFSVQVPHDLPMVRVDSTMVPLVIQNLVENALRYTPPSSPIRVSAWLLGTNVVVRVSDEGAGLAAGERTRVFERLYRGQPATPPTGGGPRDRTGSSSGIGLGLTICEGIVRAHGGRIWTEPVEPNGASFLFSLPVEYPQPATPREGEPRRAEPTAP